MVMNEASSLLSMHNHTHNLRATFNSSISDFRALKLLIFSLQKHNGIIIN